MSLKILMFGQFKVERDGQSVSTFETTKVQELFAYLLLHRDKAHHRESLANVLWAESSSRTQVKAYLRKALWQLQKRLSGCELPDDVLVVDHDWIWLGHTTQLNVDIIQFEQVSERVQGIKGKNMCEEEATAVEAAVALYRGELLEGLYQDWCLFERERYKLLHLTLLDKLMGFYEARQEYECSLRYGFEILREDPAREHTHRRLMRIRYLAGDRTGALRQFESCEHILLSELGVEPAQRTKRLYTGICQDQLSDLSGGKPTPTENTLEALRSELSQLNLTIQSMQQRLVESLNHLEEGR